MQFDHNSLPELEAEYISVEYSRQAARSERSKGRKIGRWLCEPSSLRGWGFRLIITVESARAHFH